MSQARTTMEWARDAPLNWPPTPTAHDDPIAYSTPTAEGEVEPNWTSAIQQAGGRGAVTRDKPANGLATDATPPVPRMVLKQVITNRHVAPAPGVSDLMTHTQQLIARGKGTAPPHDEGIGPETEHHHVGNAGRVSDDQLDTVHEAHTAPWRGGSNNPPATTVGIGLRREAPGHCNPTEGDDPPTDTDCLELMMNIEYQHLPKGIDTPQCSELDALGDALEATYPPGKHDEMAHTPDYNKWPHPAWEMHAQTALLYDAARQAKITGDCPPRVDTTTSLNLTAWMKAATGHPADDMVIRGITHGFSIQYRGPPLLGDPSQYNHASATSFPEHVQAYMDDEIRCGALEGPFSSPPFIPWFHTSPLMTREKDDKNSRRVIVDLSYPDGGVNLHIPHHTFDGVAAVHNLPTIASAVHTLANTCPGEIHMSVIDLSRAYRHFPVSPLDWPLLGCGWAGSWTFDRRLPFGSRMSSYAMQMVADFIVRALAAKGATAHMYLDDVILISPTKEIAEAQYAATLDLLQGLGLQVALKKLQPPAPQVKWLGINIDVVENTLCIPASKLAQIRLSMATASRRKAITRRNLQRLIGLANHVAKVVRAARVFVCRLLAALRAATTNYIKVTPHMRADLKWFTRYLKRANSRAIIPSNLVVKRLWVDACLQGAGASDALEYYEHVFTPDQTANHHITQLEALNCLAAVRTFVAPAHAGGDIQVFCDNQPAVDALTSGRARDPVLAACARAMWYHAATTDTNISFTHVSGSGMALPDALSRASLTKKDRLRANRLISSMCLIPRSVDADAFTYDYFS